ncbi:MAG: TRAP transporter large permease subunit [Synergistaceae bacterium]|nr:TRAP transporter large permease subunit [Synergistaceae bacterium]
MLLTLMGTMALLLLLGSPMMVSLAFAVFLTVGLYLPIDPSMLVQQIVGGVQSTSLTAIPMSIFVADIMTSGEVADRLLDVVVKMVGHERGGLPIATTPLRREDRARPRGDRGARGAIDLGARASHRVGAA